jgi:hypothetical protein
MRARFVAVSLVVGVCSGMVGCSASGPGETVRPGGTAGSSNQGSAGSTPGGSTSEPAPSTAGTDPGLTIDPTIGMMEPMPEVPVDPGICDDLKIQTFEVVPTVVVLVDTSSSMFEPRAKLWDPLFNALMDPTKGVIAKLQGKVRFGFTSYKSVTRPTGTTTCPVLESTDLKINNFDAIKAKYTEVGMTPTTDFKWETPTGASLAAVAKSLADFTPDPPGPKFILLVTDGDPDTCAIRDPQCGQDDSIKAVQDAYAAGIGTFVIGIGDILTSSASNMRVGVAHLQDVANAGAGQPVAPNSQEYAYSQCVAGAGLTATYAADVASAGKAPYYTVSAADGTTAQTQLATAIEASLEQTRSCTFNMDAQVKGDASLGTLTVDDKPLTYGDPNGWTLGADLTSVTINGTACDSWKERGGKLNVVFPCKLVPVVPKPVKPPA